MVSGERVLGMEEWEESKGLILSRRGKEGEQTMPAQALPLLGIETAIVVLTRRHTGKRVKR